MGTKDIEDLTRVVISYGPQREKMYLRAIFWGVEEECYFEYIMFLEFVSLYLTRIFQLFCELWPIYYKNPRDVIALKNDVKVA